jgi:NADH dehydrogenase/putative oxidoreductase
MHDYSIATVLQPPTGQALARRVSRWLRAGGASARLLWPFLDLALRIWVGHIFWVSGLLKVTSWDTALQLAAQEYPVSWLDPVTAAWTGAGIELICPVLLMAGLATRFAALPLLALALVIQFEYQALPEHLYWAVIFGWYLVMGAGALSLDRFLVRGLGASAVPLAQGFVRLFDAVTRYLGPVALLAVRAALVLGVFAASPELGVHSGAWIALLVLLGLGLATRATALVLLLALGSLTLSSALIPPYPALLAALLLLQGPGALAADRLIWEALRRWLARTAAARRAGCGKLPRVVIVGAGFGGVTAARALRDVACEVVLVDRRNFHLFQPLLYQVATAVLSPADIATPIRELFRDQPNARVLLGEVSGIDSARREVLLGEQRLAYDTLILATGARHSYFGRDEWARWAPGLKQVEDATDLRRRLLLAFERAEQCEDPLERQGQLTFVVIGGGPTGVELAGAMAELARHGMSGDFRRADPASARVLLVEAGPRLLAAFPEALSSETARALTELGVQVRVGQRVEQVDADGVVVDGERIAARTVIWAAGVMASPAARWLGRQADRAGRLIVGPDLEVPGLPGVFAIGDTAYAEAWDGKPVPGLAPAAKQGGQYVAKVVRARLEERPPPPPFRYHHQGSLATIGRRSAVADLGRLRLTGPLAWWFWGAIHVAFLAGVRNRLTVAVQWFWAYLTFRRGTRLITGSDHQV